HIARFRENEILGYEGPKTCLTCHAEISVTDAQSGDSLTVDLMDNLLTSAHYRFYTSQHPNVYGFNGELADNFRMGKINRPCPKPGSFAMTAWAALVELDNGDTLSEGCGQCHIGGQYAAPLGDMMPAYTPLAEEREAIDCLICHSVGYDMNRKQVVIDENGRTRWDQDRSLRAALSVTRPTAGNCLRCHQHNMGGDIYVDESFEQYHQSQANLGTNRPRIAHPGSKRGTPFTPAWDVHAAAGLDCIDCHLTQGHYIAKGTHTTTMMANDLPTVEVACENCHGSEPHEADAELADYLNGHTDLLACQTCHIPSLHPDNATYRDFSTSTFEEDPGIWVYSDIRKDTEPGSGITYVWWNGDATFLGNPIGDNPNGENLYSFYQPTHVWPEYADYDYAAWYEKTMRPIAQCGRASKLYPMKIFNGKQHIDLQNIGPFGGMYLPYNLPTYYTSGDPDRAAAVEMQRSMMKRMYGWMFKYYMMDKFMSFMDVDGWNADAYEDASQIRKVEARWIPQDASLEISHAIRREGALTCNSCHSQTGIMDFQALGYSAADATELREPRFEDYEEESADSPQRDQ
ncbi:MAG: nitrite reductase, partial [bacterium]